MTSMRDLGYSFAQFPTAAAVGSWISPSGFWIGCDSNARCLLSCVTWHADACPDRCASRIGLESAIMTAGLHTHRLISHTQWQSSSLSRLVGTPTRQQARWKRIACSSIIIRQPSLGRYDYWGRCAEPSSAVFRDKTGEILQNGDILAAIAACIAADQDRHALTGPIASQSDVPCGVSAIACNNLALKSLSCKHNMLLCRKVPASQGVNQTLTSATSSSLILMVWESCSLLENANV